MTNQHEPNSGGTEWITASVKPIKSAGTSVLCRLKAISLDKIVIENIFVVINISNQDSQFDLHMNHALLTGCYKGWWGTNCSKSCPFYCISGHCTPVMVAVCGAVIHTTV